MHLGWLRYIFCLNGIVPSEGYFWGNIGITWTIPVFVLFYILAPVIIKFSKTIWNSVFIFIFFVFLSILIQIKGNGWFSAVSYMPCFLIGIIVYRAKKENRKFITLFFLQLFVFTVKFSNWDGYILRTFQYLELFVVSCFFASLILFSDELKVKNKKINAFLDFLDEHSYTLYLVHGITFCGIIDKFGFEKFGNLPLFIIFRLSIAIIVTAIFVFIIHRFIEKPIQNKLENRFIK